MPLECATCECPRLGIADRTPRPWDTGPRSERTGEWCYAFWPAPALRILDPPMDKRETIHNLELSTEEANSDGSLTQAIRGGLRSCGECEYVSRRADWNPQSLTSIRFVVIIYLAADNLRSYVRFHNVGLSHVSHSEHETELAVPQADDGVAGV